MAGKSKFSARDMEALLAGYELGALTRFEPLTAGSVQTNVLVETTTGKVVLRRYESRSAESARFEVNLLAYLRKRGFPCPAPIRRRGGGFLGSHRGKPYALFTFLEGEHVAELSRAQRRELAERAAELHLLTRRYRPAHRAARWNYTAPFCGARAKREANRIGTASARAKRRWLQGELDALVLPLSLPKGICHADFDLSNLLFRGGRLVGLLDFDDANHTFLLYDVFYLVDMLAWPHDGKLDFARAREILRAYERRRPLNANERVHLYDVYKLGILIDCLWYFARGDAADFRERRKVDYLNSLGRAEFGERMFA
jgi:homoserine kinase type II